MGLLDDLERLEKAATTGPWTLYRCQFSVRDSETFGHEPSACGINGESYDASRDACNHTLPMSEGELIVAARNALPRLLEVAMAAKALTDLQIIWQGMEPSTSKIVRLRAAIRALDQP